MQATTITLRDTYIELANPPCGTGLLRFECGGVARIDGLNYVGAYADDTLVDLSAATDLNVSISSCGWLPGGVRFANGKNKFANRWSFRDIVAVGGTLMAPTRWEGGADRIPVNVSIDGQPTTANKH